MLAVAFKNQSRACGQAIIIQKLCHIRHIRLCIVCKDQHMAALFHIIQYTVFFICRNILLRTIDHQTVRIIRNCLTCHKVQFLNINILLFNLAGQSI